LPPRYALRSADRDEHVAALELHVVARDLQIVGDALAGAHIVLPGVPGTGDYAALEVALAERSATMRALVVERVERAVDVEERDFLAVHRHELCRSGRNIRNRAGLRERRHRRLLAPGPRTAKPPGPRHRPA